jgi:N-acetylglucosamine kinase-like BadF-type ATPase
VGVVPGVGCVIGVDGGNSKTDAVLASSEGEPLAYVRGGGSNSHGAGGSAGCVEVIASLVERLPFEPPADRGVFFLCGADVPRDILELTHELDLRAWTKDALVDNDTFALLRAGTDRADAIAVICGAGINCVGRNAAGDVVRYPALGWETGDWGGAEAVGREALYHANRAADGRGPATALVDVVERHFGVPVVQVGVDIHYRRLRETRLGELASAVVDAAAGGDEIAGGIVDRLVTEIVLLVERALRGLGIESADVVLGGGMLAQRGGLFDLVVRRLPDGVAPVVPTLPPVAGAVVAALDRPAAQRFRAAFTGWEPS